MSSYREHKVAILLLYLAFGLLWPEGHFVRFALSFLVLIAIDVLSWRQGRNES